MSRGKYGGNVASAITSFSNFRVRIENSGDSPLIDAALELADCHIRLGDINQALELILPTLQHPASTEGAKQRIVQMKTVLARMTE